MYRVNPFTYLASSLLSASLGAAPVRCADDEFQQFFPPADQTCGEYLQEYISTSGGYVENPETRGDQLCQYCRIESTTDFLAQSNVDYADRWAHWGILCAFVVFNCFATIFLYWLVRVPKGKKGVGK